MNNTAPESKSSKKTEDIFDWVESIVYPVIAVVLIFTFVLRPVGVKGISMEPTLTEGDRLFISYLFYTPKKHDIVVVNSTGLNEPIIKRVIGLPGDTIDIDFENGLVYVNGEEQDEPYIAESTYNSGEVKFPLTVPEDTIFVMGDNRNHSEDSRFSDVGCVSMNDIVGKAVFRLFPFSSAGLLE